MGRNFWTPWRKRSKLARNTTVLDGPLKIIARHTVVSGNGSYIPFHQKTLRRDFSGVEHFAKSAELGAEPRMFREDFLQGSQF